MKKFFTLLVCAWPVFAGPITVSSYTINTPTEAPYPDDTGVQLIDGSFGTTDLSSSGAAIPWVGWINTNAISMTFNFSSIQSITAVSIDFLLETQNFAFLPDSINIGGQVFSIDPNAIGNPATGFLTFNLSSAINTQSLAVELDRASTGFHILIDEVTFAGNSTSATPEPATFAIIGSGLLGLALIARRR
jgi:hypothetical protein